MVRLRDSKKFAVLPLNVALYVIVSYNFENSFEYPFVYKSILESGSLILILCPNLYLLFL